MTDTPDADAHRRQLEGIANRAVAHRRTMPVEPDRPRGDYYTTSGTLRDLECVESVRIIGHYDGLEIVIDRADLIPGPVLDRLRTHGFGIDPSRTMPQGDSTVIVARS